jgi:SPP1 gp7 family putative phage head morphogenesis protein
LHCKRTNIVLDGNTLARKVKVSPSKIPRFPRSVEVKYIRSLRDFNEDIMAIILYGLTPLLENWPVVEDAEPGDISAELMSWVEGFSGEGESQVGQLLLPFDYPDPDKVTIGTIEKQIKWINFTLAEWTKASDIGDTVDLAGWTIDRYVTGQLARVLPIDVRREIPGIGALINGWRDENINLIESGIWAAREPVKLRPAGLLPDVSDLVEQAHSGGWRVEELTEELRNRYGTSERRSELIARDQIGKLNGQIHQYRQQEAGIMEAVWVATRDVRTRKSHRAMDGVVFRWDSLPIVDGESVRPGQPIQCRCMGAPVAPDWLN